MLDDNSGQASLRGLAGLAAELGDLKRLRDASSSDSLASRLFRRAWSAMIAGQPVSDVAYTSTAAAVVACRLGGIDRPVLVSAGLMASDALLILDRGFEEMAAPIDGDLAERLRNHVDGVLWAGPVVGLAETLIRQPRGGATCPGRPRIVLEPPENHGDHCMIVAVLACLLAPRYGADPEQAFLAGMVHHLHNVHLPDSGFAGEMLLGDHLAPVMRTLFDRELTALPSELAANARAVLSQIATADNPLGQAFNAADVIDRVLQMAHYDQVAQFRTAQALEDLHLVHAGPVQVFHYAVLRESGLI